MSALLKFDQSAIAVRLYRIVRDDAIPCEAVEFARGAVGINTVLRRAAISGRVEVDGKIEDHFADLLDRSGDIVNTVALDARSYKALKTKWMRCKVEPPLKERLAALGLAWPSTGDTPAVSSQIISESENGR